LDADWEAQEPRRRQSPTRSVAGGGSFHPPFSKREREREREREKWKSKKKENAEKKYQ